MSECTSLQPGEAKRPASQCGRSSCWRGFGLALAGGLRGLLGLGLLLLIKLVVALVVPFRSIGELDSPIGLATFVGRTLVRGAVGVLQKDRVRKN
jgi:hypothetical protein